MKSTQGTALSRAKRCTAASKASVILASGAVEAIELELPMHIPHQPLGVLQARHVDVAVHPVDTVHLHDHVLGQDIGDGSRYGHDGLRSDGRPVTANQPHRRFIHRAGAPGHGLTPPTGAPQPAQPKACLVGLGRSPGSTLCCYLRAVGPLGTGVKARAHARALRLRRRSDSIGPKGSAYVFHEQHEVKFVGRTGLELGYEMNVKVAGVGGFSVDEQASTTDAVAEFSEPSEDVLEHASCKAGALVVDVHAESSEEGNRLGIAAGTFAHPTGGGVRVELGHAPGVIGDDSVAVVLGDDEDSRRADRG